MIPSLHVLCCFLYKNVTNDAYAILFAVKNTAFNNVYAIKNHAYCAVLPRLCWNCKICQQCYSTSYVSHITSMVWLFQVLLFVLSIMVPKNISLTPSNNFDTIINVPIIPGFKPTVFVRYNITNDERNAYTTFPAKSPDP